jgi:hypothetical protein
VENEIYLFDLSGTFTFGDIPEKKLVEILKDGRVASHLLEAQLEIWFSELRHIPGCKSHDHVNKYNGKKYDAKNFTKKNGCKFMPSSMIGTGRSFDPEVFIEKANGLYYIICDIIDFPRVRVKCMAGKDLLAAYPNGRISKTKREILFS